MRWGSKLEADTAVLHHARSLLDDPSLPDVFIEVGDILGLGNWAMEMRAPPMEINGGSTQSFHYALDCSCDPLRSLRQVTTNSSNSGVG